MRFSAVALAVTAIALSAADAQAAAVTQLRCESADDPLGIDAERPRFSWVVTAAERGVEQAAYQILVATSPQKLARGEGDAWDSGKVTSAENAQIPYAGAKLESRRRYHFTVRVWDGGRRLIKATRPASFEMGILDPAAWRARPIGLTVRGRKDEDRLPLVGAQWITVADGVDDAKVKRMAFHGRFEVPAGQKLRWAELHFAGPGTGKNWENKTFHRIWVNGKRLRDFASPISDPRWLPVAGFLKPGSNTITISSPVLPPAAGRAIGVAIRWELADGTAQAAFSDGTWRARPFEGNPDVDHAAETADGAPWAAAKVLGNLRTPGDAVDAQNRDYAAIDVVSPPVLLRRAFSVAKPVARARLYATAAGIYELHVNGRRVGDERFAPGWTDYGKRVRYQTYDVTPLVRQGANAVAGVIAGGWFSGRTGVGQNLWGFGKALVAQLHVDYADGTSDVIATDGAWRATTGPWRRADMLDGEVYDARRADDRFSTPQFDDKGWSPAEILAPKLGRLEAQIEPPVRVTGTLPARAITTPAPGVQIFDLGQNMVGTVRVKLRAPAGTAVQLRYAEMLAKDGTMFVEALRTANAIDRYIARGGGEETFEPRFTFHGFRYVEISGLPRPLPRTAVTGVVLNSALRTTGKFETSSAPLNQLQSNIVWGQRGNFLSVPTDCPQRDERLGWSGDINVFARTATFNMDSASFLAKFAIDMEDGQRADGRFPDVAPGPPILGAGNFGWADVGVMLPWLLYETYGDRRVLERHYESAKRWVDFRTSRAKDWLNTSWSFGDWVSPEPKAPNEVIGPIYHAASARILGRMAGVLGKPEDAAKYEDQFQKIRAAWVKAHVAPDGAIKSDTQTVYVLALRYDMLPEELRPQAAKRLVAAIARAGNHLATGFLGTGNLLPALTMVGRSDLAYELLMKDTNPSWLFSVKNGATTIWERWDGYSPVAGPNNKGDMNSYNHYAFGAVGEWMYAHVAGIDFDRSGPAWRQLIIRPLVGGGLTHARGEHDTIRGKVATAWKVDGGRFSLNVEVPVHARARIHVPAKSADDVREGGKPAASAAGLRFVELKDGAAIYEAAPGRYAFTSVL